MKSVFVDRDGNNNIINRFARPQYEGQERLDENDQELIDLDNIEQAAVGAMQTRQQEIETEKESAGLKGVTPQQAYAWIDNQFAGVADVSALRDKTIEVLKRMVPYILE